MYKSYNITAMESNGVLSWEISQLMIPGPCNQDFIGGVALCPNPCCMWVPCTSSSRVLYPGCRLGYVSGNPEHEDMSSGSTSYRQKWENLHYVLIFLHIQEPQPISTSKSDQQREKWSGLFVKKDAGICGCSYASRINFMTGTDLAVSILISRF